jgi:phosphatidylserine/phosphatidylglycerophosphate/cardiolipin synthase-like enzyme
VADLLRTENSVLRFCGHEAVPQFEVKSAERTGTTVQVLTERAIKFAALDLIGSAAEDKRIDLAAFYLSDRDVIAALIDARRRGVLLRILLDPNKDAFGHNKFGVPNRPVAAELHGAGIDLRWSHTHGEQCHAKMLLRSSKHGAGQLLLGSANLTRRNLDDFNLETNVLIRGLSQSAAFRDARAYFDLLWHNGSGAIYSVAYNYYRDESRFRKYLYRFMEASGMCTF